MRLVENCEKRTSELLPRGSFVSARAHLRSVELGRPKAQKTQANQNNSLGCLVVCVCALARVRTARTLGPPPPSWPPLPLLRDSSGGASQPSSLGLSRPTLPRRCCKDSASGPPPPTLSPTHTTRRLNPRGSVGPN